MFQIHRRSAAVIIAALSALALSSCGEETASSEGRQKVAVTDEVNIYSGRHYDADLAIYDAFTEETGVKVNLIEARGDALIERLAREKDASPADLFITADAGILWRAETRDVLSSIDDASIMSRVPAQFQHPEGLWIGLAKRARIVIYNKEMGLPEGLADYADLADPAYRGMICVRSSSNIYNQSLLASIIAHEGAEAAEAWARGVVANFARRPEGNDTSQIEAVAAGLCRIGIVNSYYVARFIDAEDERASNIGDKIGVLFPDQGGRGAHVNISGVGITASAPNRANALKLIEYLLRDETQAVFALSNNEYPVVDGAPTSGPVARLGDFEEDRLPVSAFGQNQSQAVEIFDRVGWP
ncbi:MAG: extracellular solute-binding protein [Pseudomonadota bacterium]